MVIGWFLMVCIFKIVFCGGLMIGVDINELNILLLVIVKLLLVKFFMVNFLLCFFIVNFLIVFLMFVIESLL